MKDRHNKVHNVQIAAVYGGMVKESTECANGSSVGRDGEGSSQQSTECANSSSLRRDAEGLSQ